MKTQTQMLYLNANYSGFFFFLFQVRRKDASRWKIKQTKKATKLVKSAGGIRRRYFLTSQGSQFNEIGV